MTIEAGSSQGVARSSSANESRSAKGKQSTSESGGAGGFMAVLASVETPEAPAPVAADNQAAKLHGKNPSEKPQEKSTGLDASAIEPRLPATDGVVGDGVTQDYTSTVGEDASLKLPSDGISSASDPAAAAAVALLGAEPKASMDVPMDAVALLAQSAAWAGGSAEQGAGKDLPGGLIAGVMAGVRPAQTPVPAPLGATVSPDLTGDKFTDGALKGGKGHPDTKTKSMQGASPSGMTADVPDGKTAAIQPKVTDFYMAPLATVLANVGAAATMQREDQPRERSVFRSNSNEGSTVPQAVTTASPTLTVSNTSEVIAPTDAFVAEKVSYWISNNVQNAEMKLDGMGDKPVEVSIRMQGNEAHVSFRTDELQTRAALENAGVHLKDLLQREGLVLSGVSVGTAGTGDSGGQGGKPRQGARQATVSALQPIHTDMHSTSTRVGGGGLDLFV